MNLQVGVKAIITNSSNQILLLKRDFENYPGMNKSHAWDLPGGRIQPGTTLASNLEREIKEETGLILNTKPQLLTAQDIIKLPDLHVVRLTYRVFTEGEIALSDEHVDFIWIDMTEAIKLQDLDPYALEAINLLNNN